MNELVIIGAGGFGREVRTWAKRALQHGNEWIVKGFIDDNPNALDGIEIDAPLLGAVQSYKPSPAEVFVCAIGSIAEKKRCIEAVRSNGGRFAQLIHRTAILGDRVRMGEGVIVCPQAVISTEASLGDHVTVNYLSSVAHDSALGAFTQIHCHVDITGCVQIGSEVLVGSRASILPGIRVGSGAVIGAGSVVLRDVPDGVTVMGSPARALPRQEN